MSGPGRFGAVLTAMVTPFDDDGNLDLDAAAELARWLVAHGSDGLVVSGTTGESPVLSDEELADLWRAVSEAVTAPVVAGTGNNDTRHSVALTKVAADAGVSAVLAVCPYYSRPPQSGIAGHLRAMAEAAGDLPVMLYDIPGRTARKIAHETLLELARVPNIVACKDAQGDIGATARLVAEAPPGFEVYSGNDDQNLAQAAVGAVGTVSVASHWAGPQIQAMLQAFWKGDVDDARRLNQLLLPSYRFETSDWAPNPLPAKAAMRAQGIPVGQCRLPLGPAPDGLDEQAAAIVASLVDA